MRVGRWTDSGTALSGVFVRIIEYIYPVDQGGHHQVLGKEDFGLFVSRLAALGTVVAPVARGGGFSFESVQGGDRVSLTHRPTILPPKKYFLPQRETLLEYSLHRGSRIEAVCRCEDLTILGVHTCDLMGIHCLNMVFRERPRDHNYLLRRRRITIIGVECTGYCDEHASCALAGSHMPGGGYDLFFTDLGDAYVVHVGTQQGDDIIDSFGRFRPASEGELGALSALREGKRSTFGREVDVDPLKMTKIFDVSFNHSLWRELDERCLACGSCTTVCPTCHCFDVRDEVRVDMERGRRFRAWDSCQNEGFAAVAGGENFRRERGARQRHRYYRKFRYPVEKYHRWFCTGCGRCSRSCMAGIRLKESLAALAAGAPRDE